MKVPRPLSLVVLLAVLVAITSAQDLPLLHVTVAITDGARGAVPIAGHALLISDNPTTSAPRRVVTGSDGTVDVRLRPGNYTVESDEPLAFAGKGYQWTEMLDIAPGRDATLTLTEANAEVVAPPAPAATSPSAGETAADLTPWHDSVVSIWTPISRASGFVIDAAGLIVTNQRAVSQASSVEVQVTPGIKVAARVLTSDRSRDVAVLRIDASLAAAIRPVPTSCQSAAGVVLEDRQRLLSIGAPLRAQKSVERGMVQQAGAGRILADFRLPTGSIGGPVFAMDGTLMGISSEGDDSDDRHRRDARIVPLADVCAVLASARGTLAAAPPPSKTHLPVEPARRFPEAALDTPATRRMSSLGPYQASGSDFDVAWLTPVAIYGAQHSSLQQTTRGAGLMQPGIAAVTDFGRWSDYFEDAPAVLALRVTPKLTESFWTTIARAAAYTQGMALPPIKHFKPGFARLRAFCGDAEVTPIHPFMLEQRLSETDAIREGLYVFAPDAFGPHCKSVRLQLYSEKAPDKPDTLTLAPALIERIWNDFAAYRHEP